jgi:non-homologous end joining protein Ku
VIHAAMDKKEMVAIGRLVISTRERICGTEIEENGLRLTVAFRKFSEDLHLRKGYSGLHCSAIGSA